MAADDEVYEQPLVEGETVCPDCWLAYWGSLPKCPNCDFWGKPEAVWIADGLALLEAWANEEGVTDSYPIKSPLAPR